MADEENKIKISVTVKTPKDKHVVEVDEDASIKDVSIITKIMMYRLVLCIDICNINYYILFVFNIIKKI